MVYRPWGAWKTRPWRTWSGGSRVTRASPPPPPRGPSRAPGGRAGRRGSWPRPFPSSVLSVQGLFLHDRVARLAAHVDLEASAGLGALGRHVGHADPHTEARGHGPAGHLAAADHRVALARDARSVDHERHQALSRAGLAHRAHGVGADEARGLLAGPAEPGLDRPALLHEVVAVQVEADLEAERVARRQSGRRRAGREQGVPDLAGPGRIQQQLDAVLSPVARAPYLRRH